MKKVLFALVILMASTLATHAQIAPGRAPRIEKDQEVLVQNTQYVELLTQQNHLLQSRKIAKIIGLAGAGLAGIGSGISVVSAAASYYADDGTYEVSSAGTVMTVIGSTAMSVAGIWLLINDFKLINNQQRINDHLILRYGPSGVALQF